MHSNSKLKIGILCLTMVLSVGFIQPALSQGNTSPTIQQHPLFAAASTSGRWWVGAEANDPSVYPNNGVRALIQVVSVTPANGACLSFWTSEYPSNYDNTAMWGQVGYYECTNTYGPIAFAQIFNKTGVEATFTAPVSVGTHMFSMYAVSGNVWGYFLDSTLLGTVDMQSNVSQPAGGYPIQVMSEECYTNSSFSFPEISFVSAIQVLKNGNWTTGVLGSSYLAGSSSAFWGEQGNLQNSSINNNTINLGGSLPLPPAGAYLWNGTSDVITATTTTSSTTSSSTSTTTTTTSTTSTSTKKTHTHK